MTMDLLAAWSPARGSVVVAANYFLPIEDEDASPGRWFPKDQTSNEKAVKQSRRVSKSRGGDIGLELGSGMQ